MTTSSDQAPRPWWSTQADLELPDRLVRVGSGRVHPKSASLVDAGVDGFASVYADLARAIDAACDAAPRTPWPAVSACGSGIRTAFQLDPPDLDCKVVVFFAAESSESVGDAAAELGCALLPAFLDALATSRTLRPHCLHLPWMHLSAREILAVAPDRAAPWQARHLWSPDEVHAKIKRVDRGELALHDGLRASQIWSFVLAVDAPDCPVSLDVEFLPVAVDPTSRAARDLIIGYKTSSLGRVFYRPQDAFGFRALEFRATSKHRVKPVASHVGHLVTNARSLYLSRDYRKALKLLIEPIAATGRRALIEPIRAECNSVVWRARGLGQRLRAIAAFERKKQMPDAWVKANRIAAVRRLRQLLDESVDPDDNPVIERIRALVEGYDARGASHLADAGDAVLDAVNTRAHVRAHELLLRHPELLERWFR